MKKLIAVATLLSLSACASPYVGKPYSAPSTPLTGVAVADDILPEEVIAYEAGSVGSNFGLIGALIDSGVQSSRANALNEALEGISYAPEPKVEAYLVEQLAARGLSASVTEGPDREKREFLVDYPAAGDGAQATLDFVVTSFGYVTAGSQTWRPHVSADVRLVEAGTGDLLMENRIVFNPLSAQDGVITLTPNGDYGFNDREDMVENPERLAEGLDKALQSTVDAAINLLR